MNNIILLVDDDADDREFFCEVIDEIKPGTCCVTAKNGAHAITNMDDPSARTPHLIFLDVNMPGISGWDCLQKFKAHEIYKDIPVIMYSTSSHAEDIEKAKRFGALAFVTKPHDFLQLRKLLTSVVTHLDNATLNEFAVAVSH